MNSDWRSELEQMLSRLETKLEETDSNYERDREALEIQYSREKKALRRAIVGVRGALSTEESGSGPRVVEKEEQPDLNTLNHQEVTEIPPNGSGEGDVEGLNIGRFSARREIENLLAETESTDDVMQGEITRRLQERFPQHADSIRAATVSSALRRLANAGRLILVSSGSGSEPNRYRIPTDENREESQEELSELRE